MKLKLLGVFIKINVGKRNDNIWLKVNWAKQKRKALKAIGLIRVI
jgi:hypothetical protein